MKYLILSFIVFVSAISSTAQTAQEFRLPEFYELANIAYAITPAGRANDNMVKREGEYYRSVIAHFGKYSDHPLIKFLDDEVSNDYGKFITNRTNSVNFEFDGDRIVERMITPPFVKLQANFSGDHFKDLTLWEDFARKSGFRKFFASHAKFYEKTIKTSAGFLPLRKMQSWLEARFDERYDRYHVFVSPLTGGTHSTTRGRVKELNECFMFISDSDGYDRKKFSATQIEALYSGIVFTEIDHNYSNRVSGKLVAEINKAMPDASLWSDGAEARSGQYKSQLKIFDEYVTHSLYLLYVSDNYSVADYKMIRDRKISQMTKNRGFVRFEEFYDEFRRLYSQAGANPKFSEIYPRLIEWMSKPKTSANELSFAFCFKLQCFVAHFRCCANSTK